MIAIETRATARLAAAGGLLCGERLADVVGVSFLVITGVAAAWDRLTGPAWVGMDTATAFFPWYSFLGEQIRAGHIPTWNPHTFGGAPFAADPESGWMYLPAMLAFTFLPLDAAVRAHLLFHVLLAGLSTYALARALGAGVLGALAAGTVYAHSGFFEGHNVCCYAYADVAAWLPLMLLGAELGVRASTWRTRLQWWGLAGIASSQVLAAWIGQGAYYATLVLGGYVACRTLLGTPAGARQRLGSFVVHGVGLALVTACVSAAGVLPRLEYNAVSNLPGGYPDADVSLRATTLLDWGVINNWDRLLLRPGFEYIGWPALLLAVAAPVACVHGARPRMLPFFAGLGIVVLVLARAEPTPLHALFSLLPGFEGIHARSPERALIVFYLAPAMLAAATLTWLTSRHGWRARGWRKLAGVAAVGLMMLDLHVAWTAQAAESLAGGGDYQFARLDLATHLAPTPGATFLLAQPGPFRYFGYAGHVFGGPMPYTLRWADPSITALEANNRAVLTGLDDIEGYNPVHVARYDDFIAALNGQTQNYHHADVFESGIDSPLLDVLNVRYVLMPAVTALDEVAPRFARPLRLVYVDDRVRIFENPTALPRAWIVHAASQVARSAAAQRLLSTDLRELALLEDRPPPLAQPADASTDAVDVLSAAPDRPQFRVRTSSAGLLVASEVNYPAWHAYVDGQPAPLYATDLALRGVPVAGGNHEVEMRYESPALTAGLLITGLAVAALALLAILQIAHR